MGPDQFFAVEVKGKRVRPYNDLFSREMFTHVFFSQEVSVGEYNARVPMLKVHCIKAMALDISEESAIWFMEIGK